MTAAPSGRHAVTQVLRAGVFLDPLTLLLGLLSFLLGLFVLLLGLLFGLLRFLLVELFLLLGLIVVVIGGEPASAGELRGGRGGESDVREAHRFR